MKCWLDAKENWGESFKFFQQNSFCRDFFSETVRQLNLVKLTASSRCSNKFRTNTFKFFKFSKFKNRNWRSDWRHFPDNGVSSKLRAFYHFSSQAPIFRRFHRLNSSQHPQNRQDEAPSRVSGNTTMNNPFPFSFIVRTMSFFLLFLRLSLFLHQCRHRFSFSHPSSFFLSLSLSSGRVFFSFFFYPSSPRGESLNDPAGFAQSTKIVTQPRPCNDVSWSWEAWLLRTSPFFARPSSFFVVLAVIASDTLLVAVRCSCDNRVRFYRVSRSLRFGRLAFLSFRLELFAWVFPRAKSTRLSLIVSFILFVFYLSSLFFRYFIVTVFWAIWLFYYLVYFSPFASGFALFDFGIHFISRRFEWNFTFVF